MVTNLAALQGLELLIMYSDAISKSIQRATYCTHYGDSITTSTLYLPPSGLQRLIVLPLTST